MANTLIIKNANFSVNKIETVSFDSVPCTGLSLDKNEIIFEEASGTSTITATKTPTNTTDDLQWASSDNSVATVSNGVVTANGCGVATITATCGSYSQECAIVIVDTGIKIDAIADIVRAGYGSSVLDAGDTVVIKNGETDIDFIILDNDYDTPADADILHTLTIGMDAIFKTDAFKSQEALVYCPDGLTSGRYYIHCDHAMFGGSGTDEDGDFGFTPTIRLSDVRYIRHSTMGAWASTYGETHITNGKFITYDATFTQIEECATDKGTSGTNLGTTTSGNPSYKSGENVNYTSRNAYGSNDWETSNIRQYLNASGVGWWEQKTRWSFPPLYYNAATTKGFLTDWEQDLLDSMLTAKKTYAKSPADGGGLGVVEDKVFLLGYTEVNLGQNNNQYESSYGMNNTIKTVPYEYYDNAGNSDRIKTYNSTANDWWLRGANNAYSSYVRNIGNSGSAGGNNANFAGGICIACVVG